MINKQRLINLTQQLIRIPSENPPGNEVKIARFVKSQLEKMGLKTKIYTFAKNRPNVVGILDFGKRKTLLLSPHLDTVPAGRNWRYPPYQAKIINGKIFGRGSTDCKGNLAVGLEVLRNIVQEKISLNYNLIFAATADEETGSRLGLVPLLKKKILTADWAVILDADNFKIIIAQKGLLHFKLKIFGKKAHGAYPERGTNAIEIAAKIIGDLKQHKFRFQPHSLLKPPTVNIGTISGGDKVNIVADWCELEVDLRFLPGMKLPAILKEVKRIISKYTEEFKIEVEEEQKPYTIDKSHPLVKSLFCATKKINKKAALKGSEGATVITLFQDAKIPAVATGFGAEGTAHASDEYIRIDDLYKGALALREFLRFLS